MSTNPAYKTILSCNIMFMKDIIMSCIKPWFSIYPWRGARKINVREIEVRENWMREKKDARNLKLSEN